MKVQKESGGEGLSQLLTPLQDWAEESLERPFNSLWLWVIMFWKDIIRAKKSCKKSR